MTTNKSSGRRLGPITKFITRSGGEDIIGRVHTESGAVYDVPSEHVSEEEFQLAQDLWIHDRHVYARVGGDVRDEGQYVVGFDVEEIVPLDVERHDNEEELPFTTRP